MPLKETIRIPHGLIGIWELTETSSELLTMVELFPAEQKRFLEIKNERRKKEFLGTRVLLPLLFGEKTEINYTPEGKPFLKENKNISISHSADYATVFISDKIIGIDVEQLTRNIDRVADRFLHPDEQKFIDTLDDQQFAKILYWSAKEAIFKCAKKQGIEFSQQINILPFTPNQTNEFRGELNQSENKTLYLLSYLVINDNVVVYCIENKNYEHE